MGHEISKGSKNPTPFMGGSVKFEYKKGSQSRISVLTLLEPCILAYRDIK